MSQFTPRQLQNWAAFEVIRASRQLNMLDPRAREMTDMDRDEYLFTMKNYGALKEAYEKAEDEHILKQAEDMNHGD